MPSQASSTWRAASDGQGQRADGEGAEGVGQCRSEPTSAQYLLNFVVPVFCVFWKMEIIADSRAMLAAVYFASR
eukprot:COSAG06_NODE_57384_length_280_cov_1.132597_1_plen_73_part_10